MSTKFPDLFAALGSPFESNQVKVRTQQGRALHYITARAAMNRLDEVLGPENWWDEYWPYPEGGGVKCMLTIRLPDGSTVTKAGIGGTTEMHDPSDTDKTGESDSLKRAAVKFGIARYLYRDGVPDFVRERCDTTPPPEPNVRPASELASPAAREHAAPAPPPRHEANGNGGGGGNGGGNAPRSGKALFAWTKDMEQRYEVGLLRYLNQWAKLQEYPGRMVDWDADQVAFAHKEALRKLASFQSSGASVEEALSN